MTEGEREELRKKLFEKITKEICRIEKKVGRQQLRMQPKGTSRSEAIVEAMIWKNRLEDRLHKGEATWFDLMNSAFAEVFAEEEMSLVSEQLVKLCATGMLMLESLEKRRRKEQ